MASTSKRDDAFVEYVCDQVDDLDAVTYKPMFGGYGLYCGVCFFGIVFDGRLYFKTDEQTRAQYEGWEMKPFQPNAKQTLRSYYEVPGELIDDREKMIELAEDAVTVASAG